ncbi:Zinc finger CCCH domain-containing protein 3 [Striga hermonthica]|uniref:Zinc finger CCCH domain-containing protein 3 n=1 Tax=Striga hermonthica TaxID=68872 RepID=A0A9N7NSS9_STRHE|nr:Zinc finger CCCH domain-containing protein 3 [Striga hermonthica]
MPGNQKLRTNCSPTDTVEETMRRLKIEDTGGNGRVDDDSETYPDRPGEPNCIYFLRTGSCGFGSNCRYNHPSTGGQVYDGKNTSELPERAGQPDCVYYLKTGTCKYGSACKYHHPKDKPSDIVMNALGLPMRQGEKSCPYYMRTGSCKYGSACKFHHPQPFEGSGGSSSGTTPAGELSGASLPKATYFANSLQLPQSYMPLYVSSPQGWNTYMVGILFIANGQIPASYLPERPDQPECRYFMNYGSCKYGSDCKYHHPRDKVLASGTIGPLGLPLRPGQTVCSYYSFYGLCKYGPTCKFDHPLEGYPYACSAYGLNGPPLSTVYPDPGPYQRMPMSDPKSSKSGDWVKKKGPTASNSDDNKKDEANEKDWLEKKDSQEPSSEVVIQNGLE